MQAARDQPSAFIGVAHCSQMAVTLPMISEVQAAPSPEDAVIAAPVVIRPTKSDITIPVASRSTTVQPKDNAMPAARNQLSAAIDDYLYSHTAVTSTIAGPTVTRAGAEATSGQLEMATMATILRTRIVNGPNSQLQRNRDNNDNNMTREGGASAGQRSDPTAFRPGSPACPCRNPRPASTG